MLRRVPFDRGLELYHALGCGHGEGPSIGVLSIRTCYVCRGLLAEAEAESCRQFQILHVGVLPDSCLSSLNNSRLSPSRATHRSDTCSAAERSWFHRLQILSTRYVLCLLLVASFASALYGPKAVLSGGRCRFLVSVQLRRIQPLKLESRQVSHARFASS